MSQRINISIPDSLFDRLQPFKFQINISKLCQGVIEKEIIKKEEFNKRINKAPEMDEIIERLRKEKMIRYEKVAELGWKDGIEWAKIAHYEDIQTALNITPPDYDLGNELMVHIHDYLIAKAKIDERELKYDVSEGPPPPPNGKADLSYVYIQTMLPEFEFSPPHDTRIDWDYYIAFFDGVAEFWNSIEDKVFNMEESNEHN